METLQPKFVDVIPEKLEDGIIYISMNRSIALHLCVCGCQNEVVTPFSPTDWELRFDGSSISLYPSIGNWEFPCKSHYWVTRNVIKYSNTWNKKQIQAGRDQDKRNKAIYSNHKVVNMAILKPVIVKKSRLLKLCNQLLSLLKIKI
ncbi:DUF6527 family protein [Rhodocytophaga aerolata]|uniref:DUF6527 family protein n=1 Tax=Rhodocytophaga aerolata TaxID=455078 RepID=A0ABT8RFF9_9BACT|nr:DUF6527 family protein [Rhodocytophaga aerolata]MDO1449515.1 DUF6527 family protein [Rhodocytophaga aerolata]